MESQLSQMPSGIAEKFLGQGITGAIALGLVVCVIYLFKLHLREAARHEEKIETITKEHRAEVAALVERHQIKSDKQAEELKAIAREALAAISAVKRRGG